MDYYANASVEEFESYLSALGLTLTKDLREASNIYIDLESYFFNKEPNINFSNHNYDLANLTTRLNLLINDLKESQESANDKKNIYLFMRIIDVESSTSEDLFWWSYYNHKFAASKGKDVEAMNEWHKLEDKININEIARFKARREANQALFQEIINRKEYFTNIYLGQVNPSVKIRHDYGLDLAEEISLEKYIKENGAEDIAKIVPHVQSYPLAKLIYNLLKSNNIFSLKTNLISNSKHLDSDILLNIRDFLGYLSITEVDDLSQANFVILINDLDLFSAIPYIDTDKAIFTIDLSGESSPNFGYLILKDEGFDQIYSFAKARASEAITKTILRSLCPGFISLIKDSRFNEQIAINYMDDYFFPLAKSMNKAISEFTGPINILVQKLEHTKFNK